MEFTYRDGVLLGFPGTLVVEVARQCRLFLHARGSARTCRVTGFGGRAHAARTAFGADIAGQTGFVLGHFPGGLIAMVPGIDQGLVPGQTAARAFIAGVAG